jgi:hypothetical protein
MTWEGGRDLEPAEKCESLCFDRWEGGLGTVVRLGIGGEVTSGGSAGWLGLGDGADIDGDDVGEMIAVILRRGSQPLKSVGNVAKAVYAHDVSSHATTLFLPTVLL